MMDPLAGALNDAVVRRFAGEKTYLRGADYFREGRVKSLKIDESTVRAIVFGTHEYAVELSAEDGILDFLCDCPQGNEGAFCKHCVATGLAWMVRASPAKPKPPAKAKKVTLADAGRLLQDETKESLIEMVLEWARDNNQLRSRLVRYAAMRLGPETRIAAARSDFAKAARVRGYLYYRQTRDWANGVDEAIDQFAELLAAGHSQAVIELCEFGLESMVEAVECVDDSDGHIYGLSDRLQKLHLEACLAARPDPIDLAKRLLRWELRDDRSFFHHAAAAHAEALGEVGLREYRRQAETVWASFPQRNGPRAGSPSVAEQRIADVMESLARAAGDTDGLVAIMARDLSSAYSYIEIVKTLQEEGLYEQAWQWAEKGLKAFPVNTDVRLCELVAEERHRRGLHEAAVELMWDAFREGPSLSAYRSLGQHAAKAGAWPQWRERALAEIRRQIEQRKKASRKTGKHSAWVTGTDHSLLVNIFLDENDLDAAWSEARAGSCSDRDWLQLAARSESDRPADAVPIYLKRAEAYIAAQSGGRYDEPVDLLERTAALMRRLGRGEEFISLLHELAVKYKRKRNFIELLGLRRTTLYGR